MAPNDSTWTTEEAEDLAAGRRKTARYLVPVAVAGVAAATIGLVPALAASGDPDLPKISAQELIEKMSASKTQQLSGTVKISTDLGLPSFGGNAGSLTGGSGEHEGSSAAPGARLTELATGTHTLRIAADGPDRQKVSILADSSEYSLIHNGDDVWGYDSASNEVFHAEGDAQREGGHGEDRRTPDDLPTTPEDFADEVLKAADDTTSVTVDGTSRVAGRDAYKLVVKPGQQGSTVGSIVIAVDAENGVPLKFTLNPSSGGKAVVDVGFTKVDFSRPAASTFDFTPPKGAKVTEADEHADGRGSGAPEAGEFKGFGNMGGADVIGEGWTSIAKIEGPAADRDDNGTKNDEGDVPAEAEQFLDAFGDKVEGKFGSGTVFKTRLLNALMTDDGTVYVGAVTKDALVKAANAAE